MYDLLPLVSGVLGSKSVPIATMFDLLSVGWQGGGVRDGSEGEGVGGGVEGFRLVKVAWRPRPEV